MSLEKVAAVNAVPAETAEPAETDWCIHYTRISLHDRDGAEWVQSFKVNCIRDGVTSVLSTT
ncbi:hypothetical protein N7516_002318 [Penicillium verrucosum]|uniref:uncharacterized protein n=1 Tax=Penicillium verrucosum TaxID=60171 RepID=UPI002544F679|nr:uncharacterized protein N7516_002318 [Penicillium verrucosum]KAJ5942150.1 hypothetical protein N7516_002318 [Penicillium verrucosum]